MRTLTPVDDRNDYKVCTCIATSHPHGKRECDEPPTIRGGVCTSCRYYASRPSTKEPKE